MTISLTSSAYRGCLVILFILLSTIKGQSQGSRWKDYLFTGSSMLASGMLDGTTEAISFHYESGFRPRFKNLNDQFWNPAVSWTNKYKNGDPCQGEKFRGSTTFFVGSTDAYHMLRGTKRAIDGATLVYYFDKSCRGQISKRTRKQNIKRKVTDFIVLSAIRSVGFTLTY